MPGVVVTPPVHGKTSLMKRIRESQELQQMSLTLSNPDATVEQIGKAGVRTFVMMYGGKKNDSLNCLRHAKFMEMITSSKLTSLDPQKLPLTERAAYFHSLRVHLQVMLWQDLESNDFNPEEWGWKLDGPVLQPIMTDQAPAPESLKFVRCNCKLS